MPRRRKYLNVKKLCWLSAKFWPQCLRVSAWRHGCAPYEANSCHCGSHSGLAPRRRRCPNVSMLWWLSAEFWLQCPFASARRNGCATYEASSCHCGCCPGLLPRRRGRQNVKSLSLGSGDGVGDEDGDAEEEEDQEIDCFMLKLVANQRSQHHNTSSRCCAPTCKPFVVERPLASVQLPDTMLLPCPRTRNNNPTTLWNQYIGSCPAGFRITCRHAALALRGPRRGCAGSHSATGNLGKRDNSSRPSG